MQPPIAYTLRDLRVSAMRHDPTLLAGAECPACDYSPDAPRGYLVIGAEGPAVAVCGHYLAEHGTPDYGTAVQLATDILRAGIASYVAILAPGGAIVSSRQGPYGPLLPFSRAPLSGHACPACGSAWDRWIAAA